ncbi:methyltransferase [Stutzerimonas azotifigens]|uniref:methyltransferase n=1 Tax=Stutzerimonas azotifigens TaxID=291995 RepID=UPI0003FA767C|nr:methyltransferase [Stutzerimonas azotifigens]
MNEPAALSERFQALDRFLLEHAALWRPRPFTRRELPWEAQHSDLADWLRQRSLEQAEEAHNRPAELQAPAPFPELAREAEALSTLPRLAAARYRHLSSRQLRDIPGRKLAQIQAFADCLPPSEQPRHWLDWCAGKGHLGRYLTQAGDRLSALEWDPALAQAGRQLSARAAIEAEHHCVDVLTEGATAHLTAGHSAVALHACGDLHIRLLQLAAEAGCPAIAVAPCCYNRIAGRDYRPLSSAARASALRLDIDDLALPLTETVTAGTRERRQRDHSMARRLAFDLLQRELRGEDDYLPTPSLPSAWLHEPFAAYCRHLAELKGLPCPAERDWAALEQQGWTRLAQVRNLELLRALFRRPLETWLLLDRALYLEEQGYRVTLGTFCEPTLTPRNALLLAQRVAG